MAATRPRGVGPVVARPTTRRRAISAVVARRATRRRAISAVVVRRATCHRTISAVVAQATLVVARPYTRRWVLRTCRRTLNTRRRKLSTRRRALPLIVARCIPVVARCMTRRHTPSRARPALVRASPISMRVRFFFPRTLSEHPGLHLPRRLLARFSKGC